MNNHLKKLFIVLGATIALSGCSLTNLLTKKDASSTENPTSSPATSTSQTNTSPTSEMESASYKIENTSPTATPKPITGKSDDPEDLQKELDSVSMESDFGLLVK